MSFLYICRNSVHPIVPYDLATYHNVKSYNNYIFMRVHPYLNHDRYQNKTKNDNQVLYSCIQIKMHTCSLDYILDFS